MYLKISKKRSNKMVSYGLSGTTGSTIPKTFFNTETGLINPHFKRQLDKAGFVAESILKDHDPYHILNVSEVMQRHYFQKDLEFYKKGNQPSFKITYDQAKDFLDEEYSTRSSEMPTA